MMRLCGFSLSFFFFKQKTAYEMRISDWSSDVCSSDLTPNVAMLLKQTYWNVGGRSTGLWLDHMPDLELKLTWRLAFLAMERGNSPLMDCMWNIWSGENAKLPLDKRFCAAEPLKRLKYQGYAGTGLKHPQIGRAHV